MKFYTITITILAFGFISSSCGTEVSTADTGSDVSSETSDACSDFNEASCKSHSKCHPIFAQPYQSDKKCLATKVFTICALVNDTQCNNQISGVLEDPDGRCWFQSAVCSPSNWNVIEEGESSPCNVVIQGNACIEE